MKQVFELAPGFVRAKIGGVPLLTIAGLVTSGFMAFATYFAWIPSPLVNNLVIVGIYASGIILYFIIKYVQSTRGIDLKYVFAKIPPE
jgi:hypothetical protein